MEKGYIGLDPKEARPDDLLCLGGNLPFIIRSKGISESASEFELIGESYVHGIMDGEAMKDVKEEQFENFVLT